MADVTWTFAEPWWGLLLPLTLVLLRRRASGADDVAAWQQSRETVVRYPLVAVLQKAGSVSRETEDEAHERPFWLRLWRVMLVVGLIVLLMAPGRLERQTETVMERQTVTVVFIVETAVSFLLEDYRADGRAVSRLAAVQAALDQVVQTLEKGRVGLIVYAEQAAVLLPVTEDRQVFRFVLHRLKPYLMGRTDEGVGEALALALAQQPDMVILVSDGLNRPVDTDWLLDALALAQSEARPIFTIGVGAGRQAADRRHAGLLFQPLDERTLQQLAELTGGRYVAVHETTALTEALQKIVRERQSVRPVTQTVERWHSMQHQGLVIWLVGFALYLIIVAVWAGRRHVPV